MKTIILHENFSMFASIFTPYICFAFIILHELDGLIVEIDRTTIWASKQHEHLSLFRGSPTREKDSTKALILHFFEFHVARILHKMATIRAFLVIRHAAAFRAGTILVLHFSPTGLTQHIIRGLA